MNNSIVGPRSGSKQSTRPDDRLEKTGTTGSVIK